MFNKAMALTLGIGIVVFVLIGFFLGFDSSFPLLLDTFSHNSGYLLLAVACQFLSLTTVWLRWHYIVSQSKTKLKMKDTLLITLVGGAVNNLTPSARMGGEAVKMFLLNQKAKVRTGLSASTIITEKLFDGIVFSVLAVITIIFAAQFLPPWVLLSVLFAFSFAVGMIILSFQIAYNKRTGEKIVKGVIRRFGWLINKYRPLPIIRKHALESLEIFNHKTKRILTAKRIWFYGLSFSTLSWVFDILRGFFIFKALGLDVSLPVIALVLILAMLVGSLPLLPGGLGSMESVMIIIYTSSGISLAAAGMQTLIDRTLSFWLVTGIGLMAAYLTGIDINKVKKNE